jgi:hypothetical protein
MEDPVGDTTKMKPFDDTLPLAPITMIVELFLFAASSIPAATDSETMTSDLMDGMPRLF